MAHRRCRRASDCVHKRDRASSAISKVGLPGTINLIYPCDGIVVQISVFPCFYDGRLCYTRGRRSWRLVFELAWAEQKRKEGSIVESPDSVRSRWLQGVLFDKSTYEWKVSMSENTICSELHTSEIRWEPLLRHRLLGRVRGGEIRYIEMQRKRVHVPFHSPVVVQIQSHL